MLRKNPITDQSTTLIWLAMIYAIINVTSTSLVYKIVKIGSIVITAGALLSPIWYFVADIITEVYGYNISRKLIWIGLICEFFFVGVCYLLIHLPSPDYWIYQNSYDIVLGRLPRVFIGSLLGTLLGAFVNIYLVAKWKIILRGKYFWLRSIGSNAVGQLVFSTVTASIDLLGVIPLFDIVKTILVAYLMKIFLIPIVAIPSAILANYIKENEGIDSYDYNTSFNPFKIFESRKSS